MRLLKNLVLGDLITNIQMTIAEMNIYLKMSIIALLTVIDLLLVRAFVKDAANKDKPKFKAITILLFVLVSAILVIFSIFGFKGV